jgi:hypothetical protein
MTILNIINWGSNQKKTWSGNMVYIKEGELFWGVSSAFDGFRKSPIPSHFKSEFLSYNSGE